jgi:hypothetical protein
MRVLLVALAAAFLTTACAPSARRDACPEDFAVSLTIYAGDPGLQPAWYLVEPDGVLRAALGERTAASTLPPVVRTLPRHEVESLWRTLYLRDLYNEAPPEDRTIDVGGTAAAPLAEVYFAGYGRRRTVNVSRTDSDGRETARLLAIQMRRLAWIPKP